LMASCIRNVCAKNRQNPLILLKVTIDNVGVPFLRHSVVKLSYKMATAVVLHSFLGKKNKKALLAYSTGTSYLASVSYFPWLGATATELWPFHVISYYNSLILNIKKVKRSVLLVEPNLTATGCHLPYGITHVTCHHRPLKLRGLWWTS